MIDLTELTTELGEIDKDFAKKIRYETAKCTLKLIGIFVATISFLVIGLLLHFYTVLKATPIVCYFATGAFAPFACKLSLDELSKSTDNKVLLSLAALEKARDTIHTFAENHKEEIEQDDTN